MTHTISTDWKSEMTYEVETVGGKLTLDATPDENGKARGMTPKYLMLVSLAGCTSMDVTSLLEKMRAQVTDFKIEVEGNLTEEHPKYYDKVKMIYKFKGEDLQKDKIEKAVKLSVDRYCGVYEMFRQFADVSYEIQYN
ncbi:MAG: OsmC family protein [Flavobacteriales bacterium]